MFADGHCDYLYKLDNKEVAVATIPNLISSKIILQNFAIFVEPQKNLSIATNKVLRQVMLFQRNVVNANNVIQLKYSNQLKNIKHYLNNKMLAILALEGCDTILPDNNLFDILWDNGTRIFGLTWNKDNHFATSCTTITNEGLSLAGKEFINHLIKKNGIIDASHLSERSFWDIVNLENKPALIASHSNCAKICNHIRNISNEQIKAIIKMQGVIGINFVPMFLNNSARDASIMDVIKHIDLILELGGEDNIAIGSDYDGARLIKELENPEKLYLLKDRLAKIYSKELVDKITHLNWIQFMIKNLPEDNSPENN
ncbi:dipeptidase [Desulfuribacillus alkaliarsenatis]|uniref:Peptidase n=1 Tax=Desulfuribacillus alkaliarsenatis TaxID=766136 RepID=A0A1E5G683_9FIRM|nr:membrane dipeptidase [Desulfuribacillus alkaliarsenatis]OEF98681.1 hypothetical protein BHF68_03200 [Desulfuribacillus alkaliarsenatis]